MQAVKKYAFHAWEILLYALLASVISVTAYWYAEEDSYVFATTPQDVQVIERGGILSFERYVCPKKRDVKVDVSSYVVFEDGYSIRIGGYKHPAIEKCAPIGVKKLIPYYIGEGKYSLSIVLEYDINPLKSVTRVLMPIEFEVKNGD